MAPSLRKSVPAPLQRAGRRLYVAGGAATSALRVRPDFIMIGASRGGTTSLFRALMEHPDVVRPTFHKGINYFDLSYFRGPAWYAGHFPTRAAARHRVPAGHQPHVFEASGYYMFHPFAPERMARELPDVKLVAMLRDPVERAYSAYQHELSRGFEHETFERALDLEPERLAGEVALMRRDPAYESFSHRHHSYVGRGEYAVLLERWFEHFPAEQVHVLGSELFFTEPEQTFADLAAFLGLPPHEGMHFKRYNAEPRSGMDPATMARLDAHFASHNARLVALLGDAWRAPGWATLGADAGR